MVATLRGISASDRTGTINSEGVREFTVNYLVQTDDKTDGPNSVSVAAGVPSIGEFYTAGNDSDFDAVCIQKTIRQNSSPYEWIVEATFSTDTETDPTDQQDNPLNQPAEVQYDFVDRVVMARGYYSDALSPPTDLTLDAGITASNNELFVPQPEMEISEPTVTITKNYSTLPDILAIQNCVNADYFLGAEPRQLRLKASATRQWNKTVGYYWTVTFVLMFRYETWDLQVLDQGTYYYFAGDPTDPTQKTNFIPNGSIQPLDGTGNALAAGANPEYIRLKVYREIQFSSLNLF